MDLYSTIVMTQKFICRIVFYDHDSDSQKKVYGIVRASQLYCYECDWLAVENLTDAIIAKSDIKEITVFKKDRTFSIDKASLSVFDAIAETEVE